MNAVSSDKSSDIRIPTVITIDGPAGAGKSSVAKRLAEKLGFEFLDTGALYRCVTLAALRDGSLDSSASTISELAANLRIELSGDQVMLNGENVSDAIRQPEVSQAIGKIADHPDVRAILTELQRSIAEGKCMVTEGRDQGTEVFPDSPCKFFLAATAEERARRRQLELAERGIDISVEEVLAQQLQRDQEDENRPVGAMRKSPDSIEVMTDNMDLSEVVERLFSIAVDRLAQLGIETCVNSKSNQQGPCESRRDSSV